MVATYMRCMRKKNLEIRIAVACVAGGISVALAASSHRVAAPPPKKYLGQKNPASYAG